MAKLIGGMNSGWKPYQTWNRDWLVTLCFLTLCTNSVKGRSLAQFSYWKLQKTQNNCLISWLMCSVSPSVCGWKAVDRDALTPSLSHSFLMT